MPRNHIADPVVREVSELKGDVRRLVAATAALFVVLVLAFGTSLYLRSNDLERLTDEANRETVRDCFRSAHQRPELRRLLRDPSLSVAVKDIVRATVANSPTVVECRELAEQLNISPEE